MLALVGMLVFPAVTITTVLYQRAASPLMTRAQQLRAEVSEIAHESFDGAMVVKTLGREGEETERFAVKARELRDVSVRAGRIRAMFDPALTAIPNIGVLAVLALGVHRVLHGQTDTGSLITVAYLLTIVSFPIRSIGWLLGEFPRSVVGFERVTAVLEATGEMQYGDAHLDGLVRRPARRRAPRLRLRARRDSCSTDVSFGVEPGPHGRPGRCHRLRQEHPHLAADPARRPRRGRGPGRRHRPARAGRTASWPARCPWSAQTAFLFDDTVRDNITLGADIPDEEVWAALRTAQGDGFVAALPDALDTQLGERGTSLSGGQRQRISLARALVRRPRLLILDDATSAVDPEVEARILGALRGTADGADTTLVVVAYRKATIGLADEVIHLADGRVVDRGTHAELLLRSPAYADLVNAYEQQTAGDEA